MDLKVRKDKRFKEPVTLSFIHGKFPYKLYFRMRGNYIYGRYIVVVSNSEIKIDGRVNKVLIENKDKQKRATSGNGASSTKPAISAIKPNEDVGGYSICAVDMVNVADVAADAKEGMLVFTPIPLKGSRA